LRLDAFLSDAGLASRRKARDLVVSGRVRVDGRVVDRPGHRLRGDETVTFDGREIRTPRERTYIALHKPAGFLTTADDPGGRRTVADLVPMRPRLFPVGRLDYATSGLLLLTDDGAWASRLEHPSGGIDRVYRVTVRGEPGEGIVEDIRSGIPLADGIARVRTMERMVNGAPGCTRWKIVLREGRYREIRRLMATVGHPVEELVRIAFGPVYLGDLGRGRWRYLERCEVEELSRSARPRCGQG